MLIKLSIFDLELLANHFYNFIIFYALGLNLESLVPKDKHFYIAFSLQILNWLNQYHLRSKERYKI